LAAGKFNPVVLIRMFSVFVWFPLLLLPNIRMVEIVMLLAAAKGLTPVNDVNAPPLTLPDTLEAGMLSLAPSVRATAALVKYAYVVTAPMLGLSVQLVLTLIVALPFAVPLRGSAKVTKPGEALTVNDVVKFAARFTPAMLEFSCACAGVPARSMISSGMQRTAICRKIRETAHSDLYVFINISVEIQPPNFTLQDCNATPHPSCRSIRFLRFFATRAVTGAAKSLALEYSARLCNLLPANSIRSC
jgi:hypothetical protein